MPSRLIDFHHKDPKKKLFIIGNCIRRSFRLVIAEMEKCITLCACCHRLHHGGLLNVGDIPTLRIDEDDLAYLNIENYRAMEAA
jgi:hypothetical protein